MQEHQRKDIKAVTTPVAAPIAKDPLNIPRKIPIDLSIAMTSNVWLLSPAGWYATIELEGKTNTPQFGRKGKETVDLQVNLMAVAVAATDDTPERTGME